MLLRVVRRTDIMKLKLAATCRGTVAPLRRIAALGVTALGVTALGLLLVVMACWLPVTVGADDARPWEATAAEENGDPRVELTLVSDRSQVVAGESFRVGLRFIMDPHWHVYFRNPGEAALATEVTFTQTRGAEVGELRWPVPQRLVDPSGTITTFGYEESVLLFAQATASGEPGRSIHVVAEADFLVCKVDCIPGRASLSLDVAVGEASQPSPDTDAFDALEARLPMRLPAARVALEVSEPLAPGSETEATFRIVACDAAGRRDDRDECQALAPLDNAEDMFFPDRIPSLTVAMTSARRLTDGDLIIRLKLLAGAGRPRRRADSLGHLGCRDRFGPNRVRGSGASAARGL